MGLIQKMEEESDCIETIFQSYVALRSTCTIFLFFEGKDDFKYYWGRLSGFIGQQSYETYVCRSKKNVLQLYDMIHNQTQQKKNEKICYFVDNDFVCFIECYKKYVKRRMGTVRRNVRRR